MILNIQNAVLHNNEILDLYYSGPVFHFWKGITSKITIQQLSWSLGLKKNFYCLIYDKFNHSFYTDF